MNITKIISLLIFSSFLNVICLEQKDDQKDEFNEIYLDIKSELYNAIVVGKSKIEFVKKIIQEKKHIGIKFEDGSTPLMLAIKYRRAYLVTLFLEDGHDLKVKNKEGLNALKLAEQMVNDSKDSYIKLKLSLKILNLININQNNSCIIT